MADFGLQNLRLSDDAKNLKTVQSWYELIIKQLENKGLLQQTLESFTCCKSNEERIRFLNDIQLVNNVINANPLFKGKSDEKSTHLRNEGNLMFQKRQYLSALRLYSQSVLLGPQTNMEMVSDDVSVKEKISTEGNNHSTTLALAFANRSAVLFHMKHYELCLADITSAFRFGYPKHLHYKLYDRQGKCYLHKKWKQEASEAFNTAKTKVMCVGLEEEKLKQVLDMLEKDIKRCASLTDEQRKKRKTVQECNRSHGIIPTLSADQNGIFLCCSEAVTSNESEEMGRGVFATRDIAVGDVLVAEKPYASVAMKNFEVQVCHHCCNRVIAPVPCVQCSGIGYCSDECQKKSWEKYHYAECKHLQRIQDADVGLGHLSLRMVLKAGYDFLKCYKPTVEATGDEFVSGFDKDGVYRSDSYHAVYNLVNHCEKQDPKDLLKRGITALFLSKCVKDTTFFMSKEDITDDMMYIGGHIFRHIQMCPCNAHEVSELELHKKNVAESETKEIGSAIYAMLSLFNHSCDPDVVRHCYGDVCVVRAIKRIRKGQEILDNYGAVYAVSNRMERRMKLSPQYYFECNCEPCQKDWPLYYDIPIDTPIYRCEKCEGSIHVLAEVPTNHVACSTCKHVHDVTKIVAKLDKSDQMYSVTLEKFLQGSHSAEQVLPVFNKHLQIMNDTLCLPWQDFNNCQEAVKQCYAMQGNCYTAD